MSLIESIEVHLAPALLVIFRLGGLMVFGPVFGSQVVPMRVRIMLAFILGLAVYPLLAGRFIDPTMVTLELWSLGPLIAVEVAFGVVIGFLASMPMIAAQTGGLIIGQQMGLGFARFYNPAVDDEADVVGQMLFLMALGGFLIIGGHEFVVLSVLHSFEHVPLGGFSPDAGLLDLMAGMLLSAFEVALRISAPLLALIFLQTVAMGFVAKTVPQLNILSLGFPIRILAGIFIVMLGLVVIDSVLMEFVDELLSTLFLWIEQQGAGT